MLRIPSTLDARWTSSPPELDIDKGQPPLTARQAGRHTGESDYTINLLQFKWSLLQEKSQPHGWIILVRWMMGMGMRGGGSSSVRCRRWRTTILIKLIASDCSLMDYYSLFLSRRVDGDDDGLLLSMPSFDTSSWGDGYLFVSVPGDFSLNSIDKEECHERREFCLRFGRGRLVVARIPGEEGSLWFAPDCCYYYWSAVSTTTSQVDVKQKFHQPNWKQIILLARPLSND